jgi:CD109 antigen
LESQTVTDVYDLGLITFALDLAGSSKASEVFNTFNALRTEQPTQIFWQKSPPAIVNQYYSMLPRSVDVELTAYGLHAYNRRSNFAGALKIVKYLMSKSNQFGGYSSSQDTVVALNALSEFSSTFILNNPNVAVNLSPNVGPSISARINSTNIMTVQSFSLNQAARSLNVNASSTGSGIAIVSLICNFYEDPSKVIPTFNITTNYETQCNFRFTLNVCVNYLLPGDSNMATMEVSMPSGFVFQESFGNQNPDVSRVESTNQGSLVTYYFNKISQKQTCVSVNAYRSRTVTQLKGGSIVIHDYYDTCKFISHLVG